MTDEATIRVADYVLGRDRESLRFIQTLKDADRIQARSFDRVEM